MNCNCFEKLHKKLDADRENSGVNISIETQQKTTGEKRIIGSFCPFCGRRRTHTYFLTRKNAQHEPQR